MAMTKPTLEDVYTYPQVVMTNHHKWKPEIFDSLKTADEYLAEIKNIVPRALDNFTEDGQFIIRHALRHSPPEERFSVPTIEELDPSYTADAVYTEGNETIESTAEKAIESLLDDNLATFLRPWVPE